MLSCCAIRADWCRLEHSAARSAERLRERQSRHHQPLCAGQSGDQTKSARAPCKLVATRQAAALEERQQRACVARCALETQEMWRRSLARWNVEASRWYDWLDGAHTSADWRCALFESLARTPRPGRRPVQTSHVRPAVGAAMASASALGLRGEDAVVLHASNKLATRRLRCK